MERAAKAAGAKTSEAETMETNAADGMTEEKKAAAVKKTASGKTAAKASEKKTVSAKRASDTAAAAEVIAAPSKEVLQQIVYQKSSGMLARDAEANEIFGLGDEMPVYYF